MAYDYNIAIDLEFTPVFNPAAPKGLGVETIEIGAAKLDSEGREMGTFSELVMPVYASTIARRVGRVTGLRMYHLAHARPFEEVVYRLVDWIGPGHHRMLTWDSSDRRVIADECKAKGLDVELPARWLDLQRIYPRLMGSGQRQVSLGCAADECGIAFERRHRALCDAQATGQIFRMAVEGELSVQQQLLASEVKERPMTNGCVSSIADRCGNGLAELLASLSGSEAVACA